MGDTGGRRLVFNLYGVDSADVQDYQTLPIRGMLPNYTWSNAPNFESVFADPIKEAKCLPLGRRDTFSGSAPPRQRYSGTHKPAFVLADILSDHLTQGESTTACIKLRDIILQRGVSNDDCGHIIAKQFGGKMIDYNLFPQCKEINRGYGIWSRIWKWGAELLVRIWLISQATVTRWCGCESGYFTQILILPIGHMDYCFIMNTTRRIREKRKVVARTKKQMKKP